MRQYLSKWEIVKERLKRTGEMAQCLRVLTVLEDTGSDPSSQLSETSVVGYIMPSPGF